MSRGPTRQERVETAIPYQLVQRYTYAANNPVLLIDSNGLYGVRGWLRRPFNCGADTIMDAGDAITAVPGNTFDFALAGVDAYVNAAGDANTKLYELDAGYAEGSVHPLETR
jgi:hypothetical protein